MGVNRLSTGYWRMKVYLQICRKAIVQVQETIVLTDYQSKQTISQVITVQHSDSLLFNNTNSQQITSNDNNCTFNRLSTPASKLVLRRNSKSLPMDKRYYCSASNTQLAQRIELQRRSRSRRSSSINIAVVIQHSHSLPATWCSGII
ncbi:hypothetical protein AVEN_169650-1 [Araneus ventricosus]|uniref:Uncharacterized protein n=1 Tax=Araneus ventricosus TaxID=182803 RepID=A0A4Y2SUQ4_ARAVE|nr:hypothetical protein AVEN_169650-1 [Araneus ventricosus]